MQPDLAWRERRNASSIAAPNCEVAVARTVLEMLENNSYFGQRCVVSPRGSDQAGPGRGSPIILFSGSRASAFAGGRLRQRALAAQWLCSRLFSAGAGAPLHRETK